MAKELVLRRWGEEAQCEELIGGDRELVGVLPSDLEHHLHDDLADDVAHQFPVGKPPADDRRRGGVEEDDEER